MHTLSVTNERIKHKHTQKLTYIHSDIIKIYLWKSGLAMLNSFFSKFDFDRKILILFELRLGL